MTPVNSKTRLTPSSSRAKQWNTWGRAFAILRAGSLGAFATGQSFFTASGEFTPPCGTGLVLFAAVNYDIEGRHYR